MELQLVPLSPKCLHSAGIWRNILPLRPHSTCLLELDYDLEAGILSLMVMKVLSSPRWFPSDGVAFRVGLTWWTLFSVDKNSVSPCLSWGISVCSASNPLDSNIKASVWSAALTMCSSFFHSLRHLHPLPPGLRYLASVFWCCEPSWYSIS